MKKKQFLTLALAGVLTAALLTGCGSAKKSDSTTTKKTETTSSDSIFQEYNKKMDKMLAPLPEKNKTKQIGLIVAPTTNDYWKVLCEGAKEAAEEYGTKLDIVPTKSDIDYDGQLNILNTMIAKNYEAVAFSPQNPTNLINGVVKGNQKGVKMILNGIAIDQDALKKAGGHIDASTVVDCYQQGIVNAKFVAKKLGNKGEVAIIAGNEGASMSDDRERGEKETYEKLGLKVVAVEHCDFDGQKAYTATKNILTAHPNVVGISCASDTMSMGTVKALKEMKKLDQVVVCGNDYTKQAADSIKKGELAGSVAQSPFLNGKAAIIVTIKCAQGQKLDDLGDIVPAFVVSKDNIGRMADWK